MRFAFIDAERAHTRVIPLHVYVRVLKVTRSGYSAWKRRGVSRRSNEDVALGVVIEGVFEESGGSYGPLRMHQHLKNESFTVGRRRVARLMHERGLYAQVPRKHVKTTVSDPALPIAPNVVKRQFDVAAPNTLWLTDITYIPTMDGMLYLSAVLDAYSRRIVGYAIDEHMRTALCEAALETALINRLPQRGLVHHSDRGSQYASNTYQQRLKTSGIVCSMSRRANCWDNAMIESFFSRLKNEHLYRLPLRSKARTKARLTQWIELWYNYKRVHTSLDGMSPMMFEEQYWQQQQDSQQGVKRAA